MDMHDIDAMRARLGAADGVADMLAAGWDAFELVQAVADDYADREPGMFAAFMFTAASAAEGRDAVGFAPSMPCNPSAPASQAGPDAGDAHEVAGELAGLTSALGSRLQAAAGEAEDPGDRHACQYAAREADRIGHLLGPDR